MVRRAIGHLMEGDSYGSTIPRTQKRISCTILRSCVASFGFYNRIDTANTMSNLSGAFKQDVIEHIPYCRARRHAGREGREGREASRDEEAAERLDWRKRKHRGKRLSSCSHSGKGEEAGRNEGGDRRVFGGQSRSKLWRCLRSSY